MKLDMSFRAARGEKEAQDKISIYRGPLLMAFDQRYNSADKAPAIDPAQLGNVKLVSESRMTGFQPLLLVEFSGANSESVRLCDFANAGADGTHYQSWLPIGQSSKGP